MNLYKILKWNLNNNSMRWIVLIFVSLIMAVNYYVYDAMSSIKDVMQKELGISSVDYGLIVSFYSFPNTFLLMSIFGGIILDRWGIRKTGFLFITLCSLGSLLTAYGASSIFRNSIFYGFFSSFMSNFSPELKIMILGRLLFGLGAETSIVVINKIMVKWFNGKELSFAFAVNIAIARIGTALALICSPLLINTSYGWGLSLWIAAILMTMGLLFFILYIMIENNMEKGIISEKTLTNEEDEFHFKDVLKLLTNRAFIYITLLCVIFYSAVFPFQAYCPDLLHNKFGVSIEESGLLSSFIIFGTIIFTPLFGFMIDKWGYRASVMFLGSGLLILVHLILSLTMLTPYIPMFILGIAFSLVPAAMWPSVAKIVDQKLIGTAYGVMASVQNLGLFAFPIIAGYILDKSNSEKLDAINKGLASYDYTYTVLMFAGLGFLGFLLSYLLKREDKKGRYKLELPE